MYLLYIHFFAHTLTINSIQILYIRILLYLYYTLLIECLMLIIYYELNSVWNIVNVKPNFIVLALTVAEN